MKVMEEIRVQTRIKEEIDKLMVLAEGYIVSVHRVGSGDKDNTINKLSYCK